MRILIVEEALQSGKGHWPAYIEDLAMGLRELGDEVDVLMHRDAAPALVTRVGGAPWLSRSCWDEENVRSKGPLGGLLHNFSHLTEVAGYLRGKPPYDYVLALTMRVYHILAYALLARRVRKKRPRFLLLFVNGQGAYVGPGLPERVPLNARTVIMRFGFWLLGKSVARGTTILAAETEGMKEEYERFSGLPFRLFPHPIRPLLSTKATGDDTAPRRPSEIIFSSPGFARFEKGIDLLQSAVMEIFREEPDFSARFVVQWLSPVPMPDGSKAEPLPEFRGNPKVEIISRTIGSEEYWAWLDRSQVILLPYRASNYSARVSRVAIEAVALGRPIIYPAETWLGEVCRDFGAGVPFKDEDIQSLKAAIRVAVQNYEELARVAWLRREKGCAFYSVSWFRRVMLA